MKKSGTARSDIFYTTKVMRNLGEKHVKAAIRKSLERAGLDYMCAHCKDATNDARLIVCTL